MKSYFFVLSFCNGTLETLRYIKNRYSLCNTDNLLNGGFEIKTVNLYLCLHILLSYAIVQFPEITYLPTEIHTLLYLVRSRYIIFNYEKYKNTRILVKWAKYDVRIYQVNLRTLKYDDTMAQLF